MFSQDWLGTSQLKPGGRRAALVHSPEAFRLCLGGGLNSFRPALQAQCCAPSRRVLKVVLPLQCYSYRTTVQKAVSS